MNLFEKALQDKLKINDFLLKSRVGFYVDNPENRRLLRVGMKYGSLKEKEAQIEEYFHKVISNYNDFNEKINNISKSLNVMCSKVSIKSKERSYSKIVNDYNGNFFRLKDIIRSTFLYVDSKDKQSIINQIKQNFNKVKIVEQSPEKYQGYSGVKINVQFNNGTWGEIQLNTPQIIYGKEKKEDILKYYYSEELYNEIDKKSTVKAGLGHLLYEKIRDLQSLIKAGEDLNENKKKLNMYVALSRQYYNKIRKIEI